MIPLPCPQPEGYHLLINKDHIELIGHDAAGIIHGINPCGNYGNPLPVKDCSFQVAPSPIIRVLLTAAWPLDVSRHYFSVSFIKKYIDLLSLYKFNTFHWHLTDDQGWRIEDKTISRLQSEAAWRKQTLIGHKKETPHRFDGIPHGGYYTQEEIKELVRYATQQRHYHHPGN